MAKPRKWRAKAKTTSKPRYKKWQVTFDVQRVKVFDPKEKIQTAAEAEERAREEVLFEDEMMFDRDEIVDTTVRWVDAMDVEHVEHCAGNHCKHYGCGEPGDDVPWFCTQCDPKSYA